jgi:ABC-type glycerol-3-phosphate transport system substrate-binding protein
MKTKYKTLIAIFSCLWISAGAYGQTQLKLWLPSSLDAHEKAAYQKAAEAFSQKNPSVKVNVEVVPGSETDVAKLMTAVRSGAGPDLAVIDRFTVAQRAAAGLLTDLTPLIKKEGKDLSQEYSEGPWQEVSYQNKVYALPTNTDARVLFYNKQILKEPASTWPNSIQREDQSHRIASKRLRLSSIKPTHPEPTPGSDLFLGWNRGGVTPGDTLSAATSLILLAAR